MEIEEALSVLLAEQGRITDTERVSLSEAAGRVLAEDIRAPFDVPHFPKSAMDGYAVRAEGVKDASPEHPVSLKVMGEMLAGDMPSYVGRSEEACRVTAVRVMTGAAVPAGYDAVVRQEDTDYGESEVLIYKGVAPYTNYCRVGEDIRKDSVVLSHGRRIGRVEAGVLASLGIIEIQVLRRLHVSVLSTGSELCELPGSGEMQSAGQMPEAGRIYNSIAYTLTTCLTAAGFTAEQRICKDETEEIRAGLEQALKTADVVITTGGVSVGKKDLLPEVLEEIGAKRLFSGVNVQPGTPTIGSVRDGRVILSLSGNPYAALVNFDLYFWPLAARLTGCDTFLPASGEAVLRSEYTKKNHHRRLLRARAEGGEVTLPAKSHASSVLSNLLDCNCYIDLPAGAEPKPGDRVKILRMPGW